MMPTKESFHAFFSKATSPGKDRHGFTPRSWQEKLANRTLSDLLIRVPTGEGKTLGVLSSWIFHRIDQSNVDWPRRLVWCLPMRTLVEQTFNEAEKLLGNLGLTEKVRVHQLMGGIDEQRWYQDPEAPAILVGTQDMLLSRALNRGYAMGRAAWPRAFGLLNTDSLWVMDEVQLMGVGLTTSAQIQAFWHAEENAKSVSGRPRVTWWMSATLQPDWLRTPETEATVDSVSDDMVQVSADARIGAQWEAEKPVRLVDLESKKPDTCAALVLENHQQQSPHADFGRQTLVVLNTVAHARSLFDNLQKLLKKEKSGIQSHLIHSRFRPAEREDWIDRFLSKSTLTSETNRILIATQVVEAGVDISSTCLITELAPWPSLVQRFGRAARYGGKAQIVVLDQNHTDDKKALPYRVTELDAARTAIEENSDVNIGSLEDFEKQLSDERLKTLYPFHPLHVILQDEFEELFDTSPDLTGADVDVSRFIREGEERDVKVFWRSWEGVEPEASLQPQRRELCSVSIGDAVKWLKKDHLKKRVYSWDYLDGIWLNADADRLSAGQILLVDPAVGGYEPHLGFTGATPKKKDAPVSEVFELQQAASNPMGELSESSDDLSSTEVWKTIATHCREAADVGSRLAEAAGVGDDFTKILRMALLLHDWGKAHPAFAEGTYRVQPVRTDLAKAPDRAWQQNVAKRLLYHTQSHGPRRGFRHELASMLATLELLRRRDPMHPAILGRYEIMLSACGIDGQLPTDTMPENGIANLLKDLCESEFNLLLYLIASHHGKVRCSLRSSPVDQEFPFENITFAGTGMPIRGVREGDKIPPIHLPTGFGSEDGLAKLPAMTISLAPAALGLSGIYGASWSERVQSLMQTYGPFTLGWLEAIVRAADGHASDDGKSPGNVPDPLLDGLTLEVPSVAEVASEVADANERVTSHENSLPLEEVKHG